MTSNTSKFVLVHKIKTFGSGLKFKAYQDKVFSVLIRIEDIDRIEEVERDINYETYVFTCLSFNNDVDDDILIKESVEEMYEKLKNTDDAVLGKTEDL